MGTLDDGVLRSTDNGKTWRGWNFGLLDWRVITLIVGQSGAVYAGTESGLYMSKNGGRSWSLIADAILSPVLSAVECSIGVIVGTETGKIYQWQDNILTTLHQCSNAINQITVNTVRTIAIASGREILLSNDDGQTWTCVIEHDDDILSLIWLDDKKVLVGTVSGIITTLRMG